MAENTISLTSEELTSIVEQSVRHALQEVTSHDEVTATASSKALDAFRDVAKDHASESVFELYKDALTERVRECLMFLSGSLLNFLFHNALLIVAFILLTSIIALVSILIDKKRKHHTVKAIMAMENKPVVAERK